jgi:hypothetical protein
MFPGGNFFFPLYPGTTLDESLEVLVKYDIIHFNCAAHWKKVSTKVSAISANVFITFAFPKETNKT